MLGRQGVFRQKARTAGYVQAKIFFLEKISKSKTAGAKALL